MPSVSATSTRIGLYELELVWGSANPVPGVTLDSILSALPNVLSYNAARRKKQLDQSGKRHIRVSGHPQWRGYMESLLVLEDETSRAATESDPQTESTAAMQRRPGWVPSFSCHILVSPTHRRDVAYMVAESGTPIGLRDIRAWFNHACDGMLVGGPNAAGRTSTRKAKIEIQAAKTERLAAGLRNGLKITGFDFVRDNPALANVTVDFNDDEQDEGEEEDAGFSTDSMQPKQEILRVDVDGESRGPRFGRRVMQWALAYKQQRDYRHLKVRIKDTDGQARELDIENAESILTAAYSPGMVLEDLSPDLMQSQPGIHQQVMAGMHDFLARRTQTR